MLITSGLEAQNNWISNRQLTELTPNEKEYPLYYLYRAISYDFKYDESDQYVCDITYHNIVRASNDKALQSVNKIYIPTGGNVIDIRDIKSRAISKDGNTIALDKNDIKEIKDEESDKSYRIFAIEGAEVGGEIEYTFTKRVHGSTFISEKIQFTFPVKQFKFDLQCPENLEFEFLTANDTTQVIQIDTVDSVNKYAAVFNNIPEFVDEKFSAGDANVKRIDFKLAYNSARSKRRINTLPAAGKAIYDNAHNLTKEEEKALLQFIKLHDQKNLSDIERLKFLEHEAKKEFSYDSSSPNNLAFLLQNKLGSKKAFLKLIVGILNYLDIKFEIVATSGRFEMKFNESFDTWSYLDEYLIYLPVQNEFMAPHSTSKRYGYVPDRLTATKGLFISQEKISDDYFFPVSRIGYIPEKDYTHHMTDLNLEVDFDLVDFSNTVSVKRTLIKGDASYFKASLLWMNEEQQEKAKEEVVRFLAPDAEIKETKLENETLEYNNWNAPLTVSSTYTTKSYMEQAGSSILFKIGELIGPQSELYQEKERQYEIESLYNRGYHDDILIHLPKGYTVQNPEDIVINKYITGDDKKVCSFETSYQINGQNLIVTLDEYYNQLVFPVDQFDEFREVINAAADWNKVTLILKKED